MAAASAHGHDARPAPLHDPLYGTVGQPPSKMTNGDDGTDDAVDGNGIRIAVTKRRLVVLVIYIAYGLINQFQYVGNANIVDQLHEYLGCSKFEVNLLAVIYALIYVIGAFPACEVFARLGLRTSLLVGLTCNALGASLKLIAVAPLKAFWLMAIGQAFSGVGQIFFLALPPLLAATWFPTSERSLATALGTLSGFLGMAVGFAIPPAIVNEHHKDQAAFAANYGSQCAFCCAIWLAGLLFVPAHPEHPPSTTSPQYAAKLKDQRASAFDAANRSADEDEVVQSAVPAHVFSQLWAQRGNTSFVILVAIFGVGAGSMTAVSAVLAQMVKPYGVSEQQSGTILLVGLIAGCVGCVVCGPLLDKYRRYRKPLIVNYCCLVVILAVMALIMHLHKEGDNFVPVCYIAVLLIVICLLPTLPIGLELAVELTYPLPEAVPATACMWSNGLFSLIGTVAASAIFGNEATAGEGQLLIVAIDVLVVVCLVLVVLVVKETRKRFDAEQAEKAGADADDVAIVAPEGAEGVSVSFF